MVSRCVVMTWRSWDVDVVTDRLGIGMLKSALAARLRKSRWISTC